MKKKPPHPPENLPRNEQARENLLAALSGTLEVPMAILAAIWLLLIIIDLLGRSNPFLLALSSLIWVLFIIDFLLEFAVAPRKTAYLKRNIITVISVIIPAFRALRALRFFSTIQLLRVLTSFTRGMKSLSNHLGKRGFPYVLSLTLVVIFAGGAGMSFFEGPMTGEVSGYGAWVWWTAMVITTMGSGYWPQSGEGRLLCLLIALYGYSVFGYITASITSFFLEGGQARKGTQDPASIDK